MGGSSDSKKARVSFDVFVMLATESQEVAEAVVASVGEGDSVVDT
jgi:hypothetical protein